MTRLDQEPSQEESEARNPEGVKLHFANPELLRGFILDPQSMRARGIAEQMSGIREVVLGEYPLDGGLFKSAKVILVIEPDRSARAGNPSAVIRTDLNLGTQESKLKQLQQQRADNPEIGKYHGPVSSEDIFTGIPFLEESGIRMHHYSRNMAWIFHPFVREDLAESTQPLVVLQVWDKDLGVGSLSISLFSYKRFYEDWRDRFMELRRRENDQWEVDADESDRWQFRQPVGIPTHEAEKFQHALETLETAFRVAVDSLYKSEGVPVPNLDLVVEPPLIFKEESEVTFTDIGAQARAVEALKAKAYQEKTGTLRLPQGRSVLLEGPPGNGKTSLVKAFASELEAPLVRKTSLDLPSQVTEETMRNFLAAGFLEAKAAAKKTGGRAVYCIEGVDTFLQTAILQDFFLNSLDVWEQDPEVVTMITTNNLQKLIPAIISRCAGLSIQPPNREGIKEILQVHLPKVSRLVGKNLFEVINLEQVAQRLATISGLSGRDIIIFLT